MGETRLFSDNLVNLLGSCCETVNHGYLIDNNKVGHTAEDHVSVRKLTMLS